MERSTEDEANGEVAPRVFAAGLVSFPVERRGKGDGRLSIERLTGV